MKANRRFEDNEEAVSAVIGVILMVAITVAIAATVYVYVSGMMGGQTETTPSITFTKDESDNTLTVVHAEGSLSWTDVNISVTDGTNTDYITQSGSIDAGDSIDFDTATTSATGDVTITFRWDPTNALVGTYKLTSVT